MYLWSIRRFFYPGVGTTDIATGMATGELWFKVPSAIKFVITVNQVNMLVGKMLFYILLIKLVLMGLYINQWNLLETVFNI